MKKKTILYSIFLLAVILITAFTFKERHQENMEQLQKLKANYTITNTWELPAVLNEVSGIAWIGDNLIACVQDEDGTIFIYDLTNKKIVDEIPFAQGGDYEGIAIADKDAYIMRSDGLLYHIKNYRDNSKKVSTQQTKFSADNNMESLFFEEKTNTLLTIPKDRDEDESYKSIYEISLKSEKATVKPLAKISMEAELLKRFKQKKNNKTLSPSEIAVNSKTKEFFVLDGKQPKLVVLDSKGEVKKVCEFDKSVFAQPEGLTFSSDGRMFISNEAGKSSKANILEVTLQD